MLPESSDFQACGGTYNDDLKRLRGYPTSVEDRKSHVHVRLSSAQSKAEMARKERIEIETPQTIEAFHVCSKITVMGVLEQDMASMEHEVAGKQHAHVAVFDQKCVVPSTVSGGIEHTHHQVTNPDRLAVNDCLRRGRL